MKALFYFSYLALVACCLVHFVGCTGIEAGGKLWVTRVDEKQESQKTHNVPLKCYLWADCSQPVENLK